MTKKRKPKARIFAVDTRFQQMARRPGGLPREKAIEQAASKIDDAKPGYDVWLRTELQELEGLVKSAQTGQTSTDWIENAAFRSRELRDSATTLQFELLAFIANSLCEIFDCRRGRLRMQYGSHHLPRRCAPARQANVLSSLET